MIRNISYGTFTPGLAGAGTLDLSSAPGGFVRERLQGVSNNTTGRAAPIVIPGLDGYGFTVDGDTVIFEADTSGMEPGDILLVKYDDPTGAALPENAAKESDGNLDAITAAVDQANVAAIGDNGAGMVWTGDVLDVANCAVTRDGTAITFSPGSGTSHGSEMIAAVAADVTVTFVRMTTSAPINSGAMYFGIARSDIGGSDGILGSEHNTGEWNGVEARSDSKIRAVGNFCPAGFVGTPPTLEASTWSSKQIIGIWLNQITGKMAIYTPDGTTHTDVQDIVGGLVLTEAMQVMVGYTSVYTNVAITFTGIRKPDSIPTPEGFEGALDSFAGSGVKVYDIEVRKTLQSIDEKTPPLVGGNVPVAVETTVTVQAPAGAALALDGTDGTSITPPTGGVGIRGWLSGIFSKTSNIPAKGAAASSGSTPVTIATDDAQFGADATGVSQLSGGSGARGWLSGIFSRLGKGQANAANSMSVVLSSDGPFATNFGATTDSAATSNTGSFSLLAFVKLFASKLLGDTAYTGGNSITAVDSATTPGSGSGQTWVTGAPTANSSVEFTGLAAVQAVRAFLSGSPWGGGTVQAEYALFGGGTTDRYYPMTFHLPTASTNVSTFTADAEATGMLSGITNVRFRATAGTGLSVAVKLNTSRMTLLQRIYGATFKAGSTLPAATDTALVTTIRDTVTILTSNSIISTFTDPFTATGQTATHAVPTGANAFEFAVTGTAGLQFTASCALSTTGGPVNLAFAQRSTGTVTNTVSVTTSAFVVELPAGATSVTITTGGTNSSMTAYVSFVADARYPAIGSVGLSAGTTRAMMSVAASKWTQQSVANLAAGATFTGSWQDMFNATSGSVGGSASYPAKYLPLGVCDKTCTLYVDQSPDLSTAYQTDSFVGAIPTDGTNYVAKPGPGIAILPATRGCRSRLKNTSGSTSTALFLSDAVVAI